jgi:hypothetical protein
MTENSRSTNTVLRDAAEAFLDFEMRHADRHAREGLRDDEVMIEQQTGHRVCSWCGYCEGGCYL